MDHMDISTSFDASNQLAFTELEEEENIVISDTEAGVITIRHLQELAKLRWIKYEAEQLAKLVFESWSEYEEDRHEIARPMQWVHYIGADRIPTLPSWTEMNRLLQLYEEDPQGPKTANWLTTEVYRDFKVKRDGEVEQAAKIIDQLKSLRRFIRRDGILWSLMLEAELVSDSPAQQSSPSPEVSTSSSPSLGATDKDHPPTSVKPEPVVPYVLDSSQDSDDSDFEIQDAPATSSPCPARMS